eukprot:1388503-Amorphochlora_amoeboformis.AAC.1
MTGTLLNEDNCGIVPRMVRQTLLNIISQRLKNIPNPDAIPNPNPSSDPVPNVYPSHGQTLVLTVGKTAI